MLGRIILEGEEIEPMRLFDVDGVCIVEIVDGQYRIEKLSEEKETT